MSFIGENRYAILFPAVELASPVSITFTHTVSAAFARGVVINGDLVPKQGLQLDTVRARMKAGYTLLAFHELSEHDRQVIQQAGAEVVVPLSDPNSPMYAAAAVISSKLGRLAAQRLMTYGRSRLAFVQSETIPFSSLTELRYAGTLQACVKAGVKAPTMLSSAGDLAQVARQFVLRAEKGEDFDGYVCYDDLAAMRTIAALRMIGRVAPYDGSVIGVGDTGAGALFNPTITSISVDYRALGQALGEALVATLTGRQYDPSALAGEDNLFHIVSRDSA